MKKIAFALLLIGFLVNGCKKGSDVTAPTPEAKPTASFKISNLVSQDKILEGNITDFEVQSTNAASYKWDFGNGMTCSQRIPSNIYFVPCGGDYTISLTVANKSGVTSVYSQAFEILCRGKNAHNKPPVHLPTSQIPVYVHDHE